MPSEAPLVRGLLALLALLAPFAARADEPPAEEQAAPKSYGYERDWKATLTLYLVKGERSLDMNLRRKLGDFNLWLGGYLSKMDGDSVRMGADWTFDSRWLRATPTLAVTTDRFFGGQVYAEIGESPYLIAGFSRTNLKPYNNLTFDPNDSVQLGAGAKLGRERLNAYSIFDVRLGTGQQNTHVVWRHWFDAGHRLTLDALYKSGHTDGGEFVRGAGLTATFDWPTIFVRAAYDPYVNFTDDTMWRLAAGIRF